MSYCISNKTFCFFLSLCEGDGATGINTVSTTSSTIASTTVTPNPVCDAGRWYFVSGQGQVRDCSWVVSKESKIGKRCNKLGGFGTCFNKRRCSDDPLYDPSCDRMLAKMACPTECLGYP